MIREPDYFELRAIAAPKFDQATHVHDWRNYVPEDIVENWNSLSDETRLVVLRIAQEAADKEDWD